MKKIYWLKTHMDDGRLIFHPAGEPLPESAWESIEVSDEEWQRFADAERRVLRQLQHDFHHPNPKYLPPYKFEDGGKFGFEGFKLP